ncbi:MAG: CD1375 family protein [Ruminiclostridium sp.]
MVKIYVRAIKENGFSINLVPERWREQVRAELEATS